MCTWRHHAASLLISCRTRITTNDNRLHLRLCLELSLNLLYFFFDMQHSLSVPQKLWDAEHYRIWTWNISFPRISSVTSASRTSCKNQLFEKQKTTYLVSSSADFTVSVVKGPIPLEGFDWKRYRMGPVDIKNSSQLSKRTLHNAISSDAVRYLKVCQVWAHLSTDKPDGFPHLHIGSDLIRLSKGIARTKSGRI